MQLGTALENHTCARCYDRLTVPAVYRDNAWWHAQCHQEGSRQLANATRLATAFQAQSHLPLLYNIQSDLL
jgi:hypothetical protein